MKIPLLRSIVLAAACLLSSAPAHAQTSVVRAIKSDALAADTGADGYINPGDSIRYTIVISNLTTNVLSNVLFSDSPGLHTTLVPGSIKTTPVARNDIYTNAFGNSLLSVAAANGVLTNDSDADGNVILVSAFSTSSVQGGAVSMTATGSFTYFPPVGFLGSDSFAYSITDGDGGTNSALVTIIVNGPMVWYVDNAASPGGDGRSPSPFNSLTPVNGAGGVGDADGPGSIIFVHQGGAPYNAGLALETNQQLIGQGVGLVLGGQTLVAAAANPSLTNAASHGIVVAPGNTIRGLTVGNTGGAGIFGANFGTLTISNVTITGIGQAMDMSNGTLAAAFDSVTSGSSAGAGISLANVAGSFSAPAGSLSGIAGTDILLNGGSASFSYGGSVVNTAGRSVDIQNKTGGMVALSGSVADTGTGILMNNNAGSTVSFSGSLTLNTGNSPAFTATGGGTVTATGANSTISNATVAALNISNTTIGAAGLTFRSISSSGGTSAGIILNNTGVSGGLTVTGDGANTTRGGNGTGGSIVNKTGADGASDGTGILLLNTRNVSLQRMQVSNHQNFAIRGSNVTDFSLGFSTVAGTNGTSGALSEGSVRFDHLLGNCAISGCVIQGGLIDNISVVNTGGVLNRLTVTNSTIRDTSATLGNEGLRLAFAGGTGGSIMNATVSGCDFMANRGNHFSSSAFGVNSGAMNIIFNNNNLGGGHANALAQSILLGQDSSATVTFTLSGNTITGAVLTALTVFQSNQSTAGGSMSGTIANNTIGAAGVPNSGSAQGDGIALTASGLGSMTVNVQNNNIRQYNNNGMSITAGDTSPTINIIITGNTIKEPAALALHGIFLNAGTTVAGAVNACVDIGGAGVLENDVVGAGLAANGGFDLRLRQRNSSTVRLPGYGGLSTDAAAVTAFIQGRNTGTPTVSVTVQAPGGGFVGGVPCASP